VAIGLTWDEWSEGIRVQISGDGYVFLIIAAEDEKGGKDRVYPVAPEFAEMLLAVPESQRSGFVFNLPQKGERRPSSVTEVGKKISQVGKLARVKVDERQKDGKTVTKFASSHDLRRAFGLRWSRRIFPAELMELMRHENIETTMKYYVGQQAELTAKKLYEALAREQEAARPKSQHPSDSHNTSHNTNEKAVS
jgi:integrase